MDASGGEYPLLEAADPARRESLQRENVPDPLAGEQTWPTEEVGRDALLQQPSLQLALVCTALRGSRMGALGQALQHMSDDTASAQSDFSTAN